MDALIKAYFWTSNIFLRQSLKVRIDNKFSTAKIRTNFATNMIPDIHFRLFVSPIDTLKDELSL